jgi:hypothetical protein
MSAQLGIIFWIQEQIASGAMTLLEAAIWLSEHLPLLLPPPGPPTIDL